MPVNKVKFADEVLIDISDSTVTAESLLEGTKAYGADGSPIIGTMKEADPIRYIWSECIAYESDYSTISNGNWWLSKDYKNQHGVAPSNGSGNDGNISQTISGFLFYFNSDNTLGIKWVGDPTATPSVLHIPPQLTIEGKVYEVSEIGPAAFKGAAFANSALIPVTIRYMALDAFEDCFNLDPEIDPTQYSQNVAVTDPGIEYVLNDIASGSY